MNEVPVPQPLLLRVSEVAELLAISRSRVYELIHAGDIPVVRMGGANHAVRIPKYALEAWVKERTEGV